MQSRNTMKKKLILLIILLSTGITAAFYFANANRYRIHEYFPLNESDKYTYIHHEGAEAGEVTITIKNVIQRKSTKQFDFLWGGKYNDRVQTDMLVEGEGLKHCLNKHLVGKVPLKVVRRISPPLVMIPAQLKTNMRGFCEQDIFDYDGKLLAKETIEANVSFMGFEEVKTNAGNFNCLHFFVTHNYRDASGLSFQMHTYNFWIAKGVGLVKQIHTFIPLVFIDFIAPEDKTIMNRYNTSFCEIFELKKAVIAGKQIGD